MKLCHLILPSNTHEKILRWVNLTQIKCLAPRFAVAPLGCRQAGCRLLVGGNNGSHEISGIRIGDQSLTVGKVSSVSLRLV